MILENQQTQN